MNQDPVSFRSVGELPTPYRQRASRGLPLIARFLLAVALLAALPVAARAAAEAPADFSSYDKPLYQQVTDRIKTKIMARLADGKTTKDRYFIIPFAYEDKGKTPYQSHSFMTVIRVLADSKQPKLTAGLKARTYKNVEFQAFNISWVPWDFAQNTNLCVFKGFGARLVPQWNQCPLVKGTSLSLEASIKLATDAKNVVCMWGPYEIRKEGFDLGVARLRFLEKGEIKYRADDRLTRKNKTAINCFHAMSSLTELFPPGGFLDTGFKMWGVNGTARVLEEYTAKANFKGLLLEPVNEKEDRYGFIYAESRDKRYYDPFKAASAYHQ